MTQPFQTPTPSGAAGAAPRPAAPPLTPDRHALILDLLGRAETGNNDAVIHSIQHAGTANSGFSLGRVQTDLSERGDRRAELVAFLGTMGHVDAATAAQLDALLRQKGRPRALGPAWRRRIDAALASPAGRALVDRWDQAQAALLADLADSVVAAARRNPRYAAEPAFRAFTESPLLFFLAVDNVNQFGEPTRLRRFLAGEADPKGGPVLGGQPFDLTGWARYEAGYRWVRLGDGPAGGRGGDPDKGARDMRRRRRVLVDGLAAAGLLDAAAAAQARGVVAAVYLSEREKQVRASPGPAA